MPYPGNLNLTEYSGFIGPNAARQGPNQGDAVYVDANGHVFLSAGAAPTAAAGGNAGTSPPAPVVTAGSTDVRGQLTFGTGTAPAIGNEVVVTFGTPFATAPLVVLLVPANGVTAALQLYVTAITATGFTIGAQVAPAAGQANTVYVVQYVVLP